MENNKKDFNSYMFSIYKKDMELVREEFKNDDFTRSKYLIEYFDWLDMLSWEQICDYSDLFASEFNK